MDTRLEELKKIITCLKQNGYEYTDLAEMSNEYSKFAIFKKEIIPYSDDDGNEINDRIIKIEIEFDSDMENGNFQFDNDKAGEFIKNIFNSANVFNSSGGTRKRIIKRKNTTRRNRKTKK